MNTFPSFVFPLSGTFQSQTPSQNHTLLQGRRKAWQERREASRLYAGWAFLLLSVFLFVMPVLAQERVIQPISTALPGRTVYAITTTGSAGSPTAATGLYAATDRGLWYSADAGKTWSERGMNNKTVYAVKILPRNSSILVAGTEKGLQRSINAGLSWTEVEVTGANKKAEINNNAVYDVELVGSAFYAATELGLYRSADDGKTWARVELPVAGGGKDDTKGVEVRGITVMGNSIIINLWKAGLWKSEDAGTTWKSMAITGESSIIKSLHVHTGTVIIPKKVGEIPTSATLTMLYAGSTSGKLYRSLDEGKTWQKIMTTNTGNRTTTNGLTETGIDVMSAHGSTIIAGTATGLLISYDNGTSWSTILTPTPQPISMALTEKNIVVLGFDKSNQNTTKPGTVLSEGSGIVTYSSSSQSCTPPTITGFNPASVPVGSGQVMVSIYGSNFIAQDLSITVNGVNEITNAETFQTSLSVGAGNLTFINSTECRFTAPANWTSIYQRIGFHPKGCSPVQDGGGYTWYVQLQPTLTSVSPSPLTASSVQATITITGGNFIDGSIARLNGQPLTTTYISPTQLSAIIPVSLQTVGTHSLDVRNPGLNNNSNAVSLPIAASAVTLTSVTPTSGFVFQPVALTANGQNFVPTAQIMFNGVALPTTYISATELTATISADKMLLGSHQITVVSNGVTSNIINFTVLQPPMTISSVNPNSGTANQATPLWIIGQSFLPGAIVVFDNQALNTTFVSPTELSAVIPADKMLVGVHTVSVSYNGQNTNTLNFTVIGPQPTSVTPTGGFIGQATPITLNGQGFVSGAQITFDGVALTTTFVSATQLTATISADKMLNGAHTIGVLQNGQTYGSLPFTVGMPALSGGTPTQFTLPLGGTEQVTLTGQYFAPGAQAYLDNQPVTSVVNNPTTMVVTLPAGLSEGGHVITVANVSGTVNLSVIYPKPVFSALSTTPADLLVGAGGGVTLTISGDKFFAQTGNPVVGTRVYVTPPSGAPLYGQQQEAIVTAFSPTSITATLTDGQIIAAGVYTVRLVNHSPQSGNPTSDAAFTFTVQDVPPPTISAVTPSPVITVTNLQNLTVSGANFLSGGMAGTSTLEYSFNGGQFAALPTTVVSATSITTPIVAFTAAVGSYQVRIKNERNGVTVYSPAFPLQTVYPQPQPSTLAPSQALVGSGAQSVTLTGNYFMPGITASVGGQSVAVTYLSVNEITLSIPASITAGYGTYPVILNNPAPAAAPSGALQFTVLTPQPVLTSVTPSVTTPEVGQTLTLTGSDFMPGAVVSFGPTGSEQNLSTTFVNSGQVTAVLPAALVTNAGNYALKITNPAPTAGASNTVAFGVYYPTPAVSGLNPMLLPLGSATQPLVVTGANFVAGAVVWFNGVALTTTYNSATQLTATLTAALLTVPGSYNVTVQNVMLPKNWTEKWRWVY